MGLSFTASCKIIFLTGIYERFLPQLQDCCNVEEDFKLFIYYFLLLHHIVLYIIILYCNILCYIISYCIIYF